MYFLHTNYEKNLLLEKNVYKLQQSPLNNQYYFKLDVLYSCLVFFKQYIHVYCCDYECIIIIFGFLLRVSFSHYCIFTFNSVYILVIPHVVSFYGCIHCWDWPLLTTEWLKIVSNYTETFLTH